MKNISRGIGEHGKCINNNDKEKIKNIVTSEGLVIKLKRTFIFIVGRSNSSPKKITTNNHLRTNLTVIISVLIFISRRSLFHKYFT